VTDFPKYASSVAHVYGRPRSFTESFAAYRKSPNVKQAKWVIDHQMVRGINMVEVMFVPASSDGKIGLMGWAADEQFPAIAKYIHRASYLLSQGKPAARIAVYHPTTSMWLGDSDANESTLAIMQQLLEHQHDFDFIDENALQSVLLLEKKYFRNLSGQYYHTVIIPSATVISKIALERLKIFVDAGGSVIFMGRKPSLLVERSFRNAGVLGDPDWAIHEPSGKLTAQVLEALPTPDVKPDIYCPSLKYTHRVLPETDLYFFFNESRDKLTVQTTIAGKGRAQEWNAMTGEIEVLPKISSEKGSVKLNLELNGYESKFILVGKTPRGL
jgi:hypothetical protein